MASAKTDCIKDLAKGYTYHTVTKCSESGYKQIVSPSMPSKEKSNVYAVVQCSRKVCCQLQKGDNFTVLVFCFVRKRDQIFCCYFAFNLFQHFPPPCNLNGLVVLPLPLRMNTQINSLFWSTALHTHKTCRFRQTRSCKPAGEESQTFSNQMLKFSYGLHWG